jgi:hypothetical protein
VQRGMQSERQCAARVVGRRVLRVLASAPGRHSTSDSTCRFTVATQVSVAATMAAPRVPPLRAALMQSRADPTAVQRVWRMLLHGIQ